MQSQIKVTEEAHHLSMLNKEVKPLERTKSDISPFRSVESETIIQCECCGISEDCTPKYIAKIRESFSGIWVCGLCAEAVKEQMRRDNSLSSKDALDLHMSECRKFNSTIRLNPNFYLASAMKDVAKKCLQRRRSIDVCISSNAKN